MRLTKAYNLDPGSSIKRLPNQRIAHISSHSSQDNFSLFRYCCIVSNSYFNAYIVNILVSYVNLPLALANKLCCAVAFKMAASYVQHWYWLKKKTTVRQSVWINRRALLFVGDVEEPPVPILNSTYLAADRESTPLLFSDHSFQVYGKFNQF